MPNWSLKGWKKASGNDPVTLTRAFGIKKGTISFPKLQATLPGQVDTSLKQTQAAGVSGAVNVPAKGPVMFKVYKALRSAGASPVQAAGIMGNMLNESGFRPQVSAMDSNGAMSYGLVQWNAASYPTAPSLITGTENEAIDKQIRFLVQTGGLRAASGSTASAAGGNFAANYERCQGCQPGGAQWAQRSANAANIFRQFGGK